MDEVRCLLCPICSLNLTLAQGIEATELSASELVISLYRCHNVLSDSCALQNSDFKIICLHCWELVTRWNHGIVVQMVQSVNSLHKDDK